MTMASKRSSREVRAVQLKLVFGLAWFAQPSLAPSLPKLSKADIVRTFIPVIQAALNKP